jgi:hypothetical protein
MRPAKRRVDVEWSKQIGVKTQQPTPPERGYRIYILVDSRGLVAHSAERKSIQLPQGTLLEGKSAKQLNKLVVRLKGRENGGR